MLRRLLQYKTLRGHRVFSSKSTLPVVKLFTKPDCSLCVPVKEAIHEVATQVEFHYEEVNILENRKMFSMYKFDIPVVTLNDVEVARHRMEASQLLEALNVEKQTMKS